MNEKSPVLLFCQTAALPELVTTTRSQSLSRRGQEVSGEVMIGHDRSPVAGEGVQEVPRAGVVHRAEVGALGAADVAPLALGGPLPTRHHVAPGAQCSS